MTHDRGKGRLILIGGLPGVGKTTIARALAGRLPATHLRIDAFEAALVTTGLVPRLADVRGEGYALALAAADTCLSAGTDVVVDAVFPIAESRAPFTALAERHGVVPVWIRLVCSDVAEHRRRVEHRDADLTDHAVPDWAAVSARQTDLWREPHLVIDTSTGDPVAAVLAALRDGG